MIGIPCRKCGSINIRKDGKTKQGDQKYHCKDCNFYGTLVTQEEKQKKKEELTEKFLCERVSHRGISRLACVSRNRVILIIKKEIPPVASGIVKTDERPFAEMDEIWSFVGSKQYKIWIWIAIDRNTRQIAGVFSETDPIRHVPDYGGHFRLITGNVLLFIQIFGNHTEIFSLQSVCVRSEKRAAEQHILSVLTILYAKDVRTWSGKHFLSVKIRRCTKNA